MRRASLFVFLSCAFVFALRFSPSDELVGPYELKLASSDGFSAHHPKLIVPDASYRRPPTLAELVYKSWLRGVAKSPLLPPRRLPPGLEKFYGPLPVTLPAAVEHYGAGRKLLRGAAPSSPAEALDYGGFDASDHLVSIPWTNPQRQPSIATDTFGVIYAVWGEEFDPNTNAIMFSKSTDGGITWSEAVIVDNIGTNFMPRIAVCSGTSPSNTRVHVAYNYIDMHIYDIYDTSGTYLGQDTVYEGDVYYSRSNNGGATFSTYYPIANNDIDLIIFSFQYDEGGADIAVDEDNEVAVAYYSQADEGHLISLALLIVYILLTGGLPPFWFDYTWYTVCYRASINGGGTFGPEIEIVNDWFVDRWNPGIDVYGSGPGAELHCAYTEAGFMSLAEATAYFKKVIDPFYAPSVSSKTFVADGYTFAGCLQTDSDGNPHVSITDNFSWVDYDVYYTRSTDGGASFLDPLVIDIGTYDSYEGRIGLDLANNPFIAWTDARGGDYDIYCVWSEDGGATMRSDQHKVNHETFNDNQYWPDVSLFLPDTIRRLDIDWWDTKTDPDGDIYFNSATWWRTNVVIQLHDTLANPMGGTVTISYTSFGVPISREINEGYWIIYHDPYTSITVDGISSGSDTTERWVLNEDGHDTTFTPATPGQTYTLTYYDQYWTTFTVTKGNPPACTHTPPEGIMFTYEYFWWVRVANTDTTTWANVHGLYQYTPTYPPGATHERWHTPEPSGYVMSRTIAPTYYHQWYAQFRRPQKLNPDTGSCACTHSVPSFALLQRYEDGENLGGTADMVDWTDCGSIYEYENPKVISSQQRWLITEGASGVVDGIGPYIPGAYHQWKPSIILVGPSCPDNTTCCEEYWSGGVSYYEVDLCGTYEPWVDCASRLKMCDFTTLGWVARDPTEFPCVTSAFMASIRYGNVVSVTLRNDFGYGFVVADGDTYSSPAVIGWAPSTDHVITAVTPQVFGATRYVWDHWSDGGAESHVVTVISDTEFVAYFNRQYFLEVNSDHDSPWGEGWYDEGASAEFGVTRYDSTGGIRYSFAGWIGTGAGSYTGPDTSHVVVMNNPITEEARWDVQYRLTLDHTGTPIEPTMSGDGWYNAGTMASISTDSILGDDGTDTDSVRYVFDHWESSPAGAVIGCPTCANTDVFMDQPYTLTAVYVTQYRFWVSNDTMDADFGNPNPSVGAHWFNEGDTVVATVESPYSGMYCTGWSGTGSLPDGINDTAVFVIEEPSSIDWHWAPQYALVVHAVLDGVPGYSDWLLGAAGASPGAGTTWVTPGADATVKLATTVVGLGPSMRDTCYMWSAEGAPCVPSDTCWGSGDSVTFVMTTNTNWIWHFKQQVTFEVRCTVETDGTSCGYDSPNPPYGTYWVDVGDTIDATVDPTDGDYVCVGYFGSGSVPSSGWGTHWSGEITAASCIVWRWINRADAESILVVSDHGEWGCVPPVGWNYFPRGEVVDLWTTAVDVPDTTEGIRYSCTGWTGTGCVPPSGASNYCGGVVVSSSGTITWNWQTQYRLRIYSDFDTPHPDTGEYWYNAGMNIHCYLESTIDTTDTGTTVYCTGWHPDFFNGDTCLTFPPYDSTSYDFNLTLNCPVDITWKWSDYLAPLYVYSDHDSPIPSDTSFWIPGTDVTAFVTSPADVDSIYGERWVCTGWTGTGDVPASGTGTAVSFTIYDTSSITWHWQHQYRLHITTNTYPTVWGDPYPEVGDHWYNEGDSVRCITHSVDLDGTDTVYCTGLRGTGCVPEEWPMAEIWLVITEPGTLEWQWHHADSVAPLFVFSDYDDPFPYGISYWLLGDTVDATVDDSVVVGSDVIHCIGWHGTGDSLPPIGDSTHVNFTIWEACSLWWDWSTVYWFTVVNPGGHDTPHPPEGSYMYPAGSYVTGYIEDPVVVEGSDTFYCIGYFGTGDLDSVSPQTDFAFTITQNSSIEWRWSDVAVRLDVYSDYGSPHPYGTTYWIPGSEVHATVEDVVELADGIRAHCIGWVGTGSVPPSGATNSVDFTINENSTLTWLWQIEYRFTVSGWPSEYDTPTPNYGEHWYPESSLVSGAMTENPVYVGPPDDSMYCIGYVGTGDLPDTSHQTDFEFVITQPTSITWLWYPADTVVRLVVHCPYDDPIPYGTTYWLIGQVVEATVDTIAYEPDSTTRHDLLGFQVAGAIDSLDTSGTNVVVFVIDTNTDLWWLWEEQYYITLDYDGLPDDYEPVQTGEGWYSAGDTAWIETETPVDCGSYGYYGFYLWTYTPHDSGVVGDTLMASTYVIVNDNYTLTAHYAPAHQVTVSKNPSTDNVGWILIDSHYYDSTAVVVDWWGDGSYHYIGVPSVDSAAWGERYIFDYWSDGGDTVHLVGPIHTDTSFVAYYTRQIMVVFAKNPVHETGWLMVDSVLYWDSSYVYGTMVGDSCVDSACSRSLVLWMTPGDSHYIEASFADSCLGDCDTARFFFDHWSDGGERGHWTDTISSATYFIAYYDQRLRVRLRKEPPEPYGYFMFNDTTIIRGVSQFDFWSRPDTVATIGVSEYDIADFPSGVDSVYIFDHWDDGGAIVHEIGPITGPVEHVAYYTQDVANLSITLRPTDPYEWHLDTLEGGESRTMTADDSVVVVNVGNVPCDLGLMVYSVVPSGWTPSYYYGPDKFTLLAEFTDEPTPPTAFVPANDYVKFTLTWATEEIFGPGGLNLLPPPYAGADNTEHLWMKFVAPTSTSVFGEVRIRVLVVAKYHMP